MVIPLETHGMNLVAISKFTTKVFWGIPVSISRTSPSILLGFPGNFQIATISFTAHFGEKL